MPDKKSQKTRNRGNWFQPETATTKVYTNVTLHEKAACLSHEIKGNKARLNTFMTSTTIIVLVSAIREKEKEISRLKRKK